MLLLLTNLSAGGPGFAVPNLFDIIVAFSPPILGWAWLLACAVFFWELWNLYRHHLYWPVRDLQEWTILQVLMPEDAEQTPKAMENAIALWGGIYDGKDAYAIYFEGYVPWWYSMEVTCEPESVKYYLFVPKMHREFFEGVVYGQYPEAQLVEAADYVWAISHENVRKEFEVYGTDVIMVKDDIYPIRTYTQYDDPLSENDTFVDPHQAIIEAFSHVNPGEKYWFQIVVWPTSPQKIAKWIAKAEKELAEISGRATAEAKSMFSKFVGFFKDLPRDLVNTVRGKEGGGSTEESGTNIHFFDPIESAKMESILRKMSRTVYPCMIRVLYLTPKGKLHKPNIGRALGAFKQFVGGNALKPDPRRKTNGPDYLLKHRRRHYRERYMVKLYQWRDVLGSSGPIMLTAEEIATIYHFPSKWVQSPVLERAKIGSHWAPEDLPYV